MAQEHAKQGYRRFIGPAMIVVLGLGAYLWMTRLAPVPEIFDASVTLAEAQAQADAEGKVVLAVVTADFCPSCQGYKRGALSDERVAAWAAEHATTAYLNWEEHEDVFRPLGVRGFPATLVIKSGEVLALKQGNMSASQLLAFAETAVQDD